MSTKQIGAERVFVERRASLNPYANVKLPKRVTLPTEKRTDTRSGVVYEVPKRFYFIGYDVEGNEFSLRAYEKSEEVTLPDGSRQNLPSKWIIEVKELDPELHRTVGILDALNTGFLVPAD